MTRSRVQSTAIASCSVCTRKINSPHAVSRVGKVVAGFDEAELIEEYPAAKPNPKVLTRQMLPDGSSVIAVWSYVRSIRSAQLVTLYFDKP